MPREKKPLTQDERNNINKVSNRSIVQGELYTLSHGQAVFLYKKVVGKATTYYFMYTDTGEERALLSGEVVNGKVIKNMPIGSLVSDGEKNYTFYGYRTMPVQDETGNFKTRTIFYLIPEDNPEEFVQATFKDFKRGNYIIGQQIIHTAPEQPTQAQIERQKKLIPNEFGRHIEGSAREARANQFNGITIETWRLKSAAARDEEGLHRSDIIPRPTDEEIFAMANEDYRLAAFIRLVYLAFPSKMPPFADGSLRDIYEESYFNYLMSIWTYVTQIKSYEELTKDEWLSFLADTFDLSLTPNRNGTPSLDIPNSDKNYVELNVSKMIRLQRYLGPDAAGVKLLDADIRENGYFQGFPFEIRSKYYVAQLQNAPQIPYLEGKILHFAFKKKVTDVVLSDDVDLDSPNWIAIRKANGNKQVEVAFVNAPDEITALEWANTYEELRQLDVNAKRQRCKPSMIIQHTDEMERIVPPHTGYRRRKDATVQSFQRRFHLYGGEFGTWVPQKERQYNLNSTFDAFSDIAYVLNLAPVSVSFGHKLAFGWGSRGRAGSVAFFQPKTKMLHLTRMKGAGSLAHEWMHAVDYICAESDKHKPVGSYTYSYVKNPDMWKDVPAVYNLMKYLDDDTTNFSIDALCLDGIFIADHRRYYSSIVEKFARAGAYYLYAKLEQQGMKNDYLTWNAFATFYGINYTVHKINETLRKKKGDLAEIALELLNDESYAIHIEPVGKDAEKLMELFDAFFDYLIHDQGSLMSIEDFERRQKATAAEKKENKKVAASNQATTANSGK